jgi:eukaryotic-like serine/threonine-protein kinase
MPLVAGRLRLVDVIGTGGNGPVHRAWDRRTRRFVAVQRAPGAATDLRGLHHPHLLTPTELVADRFVVSPVVRGGSVEQLLAGHGRLPVDYVAVLLDQLLDALAGLHHAGWVHRDVKPSNLLLEPSGTGRPHLRLADFGASRHVGAREAGGRCEGTPGYMAPETREGSPAHPRADLFAAGVTSTELLLGRPPHGPDDVPRSRLRPILVSLVALDPADRPASAAQARARLRELGVPAGAPWQRRPHPPDVPDRLGEPPRLRWRLQSR